MRLPSQPKRTSERIKPLHFQYERTTAGTPWEAYLAGPVWWGLLHMTRPSKPCVYELTGRAVPCRFCTGPKRVAVMKGWVPLYRQIDGQACCVPVDEVQRDELDGLKTHTRVVVGRAKGGGANVYVRATTVQEPKWTSSLPERMRDADVSTSLLNMWECPELNLFFDHKKPNDNGLTLPVGAAVNDQGKPFSPMMQGPAKAAGAPVVPLVGDAVAQAERELLQKLQARGGGTPSANGKHHKPASG